MEKEGKGIYAPLLYVWHLIWTGLDKKKKENLEKENHHPHHHLLTFSLSVSQLGFYNWKIENSIGNDGVSLESIRDDKH